MTVASREHSSGIRTLVRDLAEESAALARAEVRLTRLEVGVVVRAIGKGTAIAAIGTVFALLGGMSLLVGVVLLIGDQWMPSDRYWLAALILLVVTGTIAAWFAQRGAKLVSPANLAPTETVTTLKEDSEWLKQRLTSGATSN
jgi:uncharacterized membrane protein YqjE